MSSTPAPDADATEDCSTGQPMAACRHFEPNPVVHSPKWGLISSVPCTCPRATRSGSYSSHAPLQEPFILNWFAHRTQKTSNWLYDASSHCEALLI